MCIICIEWQKEKMTVPEARRALAEMRYTPEMTPEHAREVEEMLEDADFNARMADLWDAVMADGSD